MASWRPPQEIRVKVIGLVWRGGQLLVAEVEDDAGRLKGLRPLGGTVEFGETLRDALVREFREELNCDIETAGDWISLENIYRHEGHSGHEIVFAAPVRILDRSFYERETIHFEDNGGACCKARWGDPQALPAGVVLYPDGLAARLTCL